MRKIVTREDREQKSKRNQWIIGIILIVLMMFSMAGYAFKGDDNQGQGKINYNGVNFILDGSGYWRFNVQGNDFATKYNPEETKDISFPGYLTIGNYVNKPLYFVSKFNEPNFEITRNLNPFVLRFNEACLDEDCEDDFPIKNCSIDNVIIIQEPESENYIEEISQQENCVFISSSFENQTMYADAFLFKILGI